MYESFKIIATFHHHNSLSLHFRKSRQQRTTKDNEEQ